MVSPNHNQSENGLTFNTTSSASSLIAVNHRMSAAYVALLEKFCLRIALVWIGLTVAGFFHLHSFINADKSDLNPVEGALPIVPSVTFASVSTATALIQSESGVQSEGGVPFVAEKVKAASALVLGAALLALAAAVANVRLLLCTVVSLLVCVSTSVLATSADHRAAVASLEMVAVLSVAYSLYLLDRFRMELLDSRRATTVVEAVIIMVSKSNIVIFASGMTLLVSEVAMLVFKVPKDDNFKFFWSASVLISLAIATSISFIPCMLLLLPDFFSVVRDCGLSSQGCNFCSQSTAVPPRVSVAEARAVSEPAACCAWVRHRVSDILLVAVAVAAPVCFV